MSDTLKSALTGALGAGVTAILLYMFLPYKVEIETIGKEIERERVVSVVPEVGEVGVVRVRHVPYGFVGFLRKRIPPNTMTPISDVSKEVSGLAVYYPLASYYDNQLVDQSGNQPIEICNPISCGITLTVGSALMLSIDNLNKIYVRNPTDSSAVVEVVYYER